MLLHYSLNQLWVAYKLSGVQIDSLLTPINEDAEILQKKYKC